MNWLQILHYEGNSHRHAKNIWTNSNQKGPGFFHLGIKPKTFLLCKAFKYELCHPHMPACLESAGTKGWFKLSSALQNCLKYASKQHTPQGVFMLVGEVVSLCMWWSLNVYNCSIYEFCSIYESVFKIICSISNKIYNNLSQSVLKQTWQNPQNHLVFWRWITNTEPLTDAEHWQHWRKCIYQPLECSMTDLWLLDKPRIQAWSTTK